MIESSHLKGLVFAVLGIASALALYPNPAEAGQCRDPWVTRAVTQVMGRAPIGAGDTGECATTRYGGGHWSGYEDLVNKVKVAFGRTSPPPVASKPPLIRTGPAPAPGSTVIGSYYAGLCMEMHGTAVTARCNGNGAQIFQFSGYGPLTQGGRCLQGTGANQPLSLQPCNNSKNQKWAFSGNRLNNEGGWCADIERESRNPGARVIAYQCKGSVNQQWRRGALKSAQQLGMPQSALANAQRAGAGQPVDLRTGQPAGVVAAGGGNVVAAGGGNVVAAGGGNVVAAGGGNVVAAGGGNFIQFQ